MGTEATKYYRVRCMTCREADDYESMHQAVSAAAEHNTVLHGGKKHAEIGRYFPQEAYWGFPA